MLKPFAIAVVLLACATGASARGAEPTAEQLAFFENKVRPVLSARCYSCHSQAAKKAKGGLTLDSREAILKGGDTGPALTPGKSATSLLLKAVRYDGLEMPPTGKLPADEVATLTKWIEMGAPWPATVPPPPFVRPGPGVRTPEWLKHWAFQPLKVTDPPGATEADRKRHPIDRFVFAVLTAKGLKPAPPAARRTLIRRASLDLLGLPPTPEEVEAFVADGSADAYEKLIDKLLASPHYGERWGRHWLDVARHSDGHGSFLDPAPLPEAWRYRDWVVKALNDDVPYDRFVKLQIAGDLIDGGREAAATGFLAVGPTYISDGGDPDTVAKARAETLDDRVDTVTRGFLALTVSCARCHDHMFDPVPQADYYALAGVFNNTKTVDRAFAPPETLKRVEEHKKALEAANAALKQLPKDADPNRRKELEAEVAKLKASAPPAPPRVHAVEDSGAADMPLALRGDPRKPGAVVPRRFLQALSDPKAPAWTKGSGRLQLADAVASPTNPLTPRVMVNRVWQHHYGRPLVATPGNFGVLGEKPSHPELLDWLAAKFVEGGWSLKKLHRLIMLSDTYRRSSQFDAANFKIDGDNRYLWRAAPRKLEVEAWRDSVLAVTGELDRTVGGASVRDILSSPRRTLYAAVSRNGDKLPSDEFLRLFDFPSARATVSERIPSTVPQQSLFLLNSPFMLARGKALAERLTREAATTDARIERAYALLYGRPATDDERKVAKAFLGAGAEAETWPRYAQALLSSYEFMQLR